MKAIRPVALIILDGWGIREMEDGNAESTGLTGAGLGATDDIAIREQDRYGASLDRGRFRPTHGSDPFEDFRPQGVAGE